MIITGANLRFSGFCRISSFPDCFRICGVWSDLYYSFHSKLHIYHFLETETSDRCLICIVQHLRFSGFIQNPLLIFPLQSLSWYKPGQLQALQLVNYTERPISYWIISNLYKTQKYAHNTRKNLTFSTSKFYISLTHFFKNSD